MSNKLIPEDKEGKNTDLESSVEAENTTTARDIFETACSHLLDPNNWHSLSGLGTAAFKLVRTGQEDAEGPAREGDYIRVNIPGPGLNTGDGYDWVRVELIEESRGDEQAEQIMGMKVRTCSNPNNDDADTAHFFKEGASSSFLITQNGTRVTASYHGRNEKINNNTEKIADNIRNTAVALGAIAGLSELQWSKLIKGLLQEGKTAESK